MLFAGLAHLVRPDAGLYLSDVSLAQEEHAKSALPDTASDAERERVVHQSFVEIQVQPMRQHLQRLNQLFHPTHFMSELRIRWEI